MNKKKYLAQNTMLFAISNFGSKILNFLLVPLYTNVLSTAEYGTADLISSTASLLIFIFTLDIASATLRFGIEDKEKPQGALLFSLKVYGFGSAILSVVLLLFQSTQLVKWEPTNFLFLYLVYLSSSLGSILLNYLRAIDKIKQTVVLGLLHTVSIITLNIFFLLGLKIGLVGYMLAQIIANIVECCLAIMIIRPDFFHAWKYRYDIETKKAMIRYSFPLVFNGISWWMNMSLDKYFIAGMLGAGENGVYAVAQKIPTILTMVQSIFNQAWNLSAIKEFDRNDKDGFFSNTYIFYNALIILLCSCLICVNKLLAKMLFAKEFYVAWTISSVLLLTVVFSSLSGVIGGVFSAVKDSRILAVSTVIAGIVNVFLNYLLIPVMGAMGGAIATVASFACVWGIRVYYSKRYIKLQINYRKDLLAYCLLCVQVLIEHRDSLLGVMRCVFPFIFLWLYWSEICHVIKGIWGAIWNKCGHRNVGDCE